MPSKIKFIESKREKARKWWSLFNLLLPDCSFCLLLLDEWHLYHTQTQHLVPQDSFCLLCETLSPCFRWRPQVEAVGSGLSQWMPHTHTNNPELNEPFIRICLFVSAAVITGTLSRDLKYLISSKTRVSRCLIRYVVLFFLVGGTDLPVEIHVMHWSTSSKPALASLTHLQPITGKLLKIRTVNFAIISHFMGTEMSHNSTRVPVASHYPSSTRLRRTFLLYSGGDGVMLSLNNQTFGLVWPLDSFITHLWRNWRHL